MSKWLILNSINRDQSILENNSINNVENALLTIAILEKKD